MIRVAYNGLLYIGDAISARDLKQIYDREFAAVLDLAANEPPAVLGRDIIYCRFPLSDDDSNDDAIVSAAIECLASLMEREFRTLVACSAGMSRSPMIAAAALSILSGDSHADSLARITTNAPLDVSPTLFSSVQRVHAKLTA
ncbi:protein-tyrosine phosphatase family protein [Neorhodopirellula pilleata]|uniref:Dual specificity phosphatase, catalytic domain n=1 Tax=Neorhodopirellula pilleata TaxID=2714738 RepID=A0A5C5ZH35_9BACT|nr:dual specificity protein phosphatase [Neorhodopirellula pilleata]TWT86367.1 hypothetical protein Pla100_61160 [Neorhodopirellula pilleata]